ncbi:hypothetical protein [Treponema sp.]|uniref:hypothetical protein n=1 Tax=Treponema sp. TaxID=166 RepID=UPI00298E7530|nr:hypothetical protein [Treponema sp.]
MVNKRSFVSAFIIFLTVLFVNVNVYSQTSHFTQKIEWEPDNYAFEYTVEIKDESSDKVLKSVRTTDNSIEFSLPAGNYLYRIFAYDFLGRQASVTDWKNLTIIKALKPKINLVESSVSINKNSKKPVVIPVDVERITDESVITLINKESGQKIEGTINLEKDAEGSVKSSSVQFPHVAEGKWSMIVKNPSGLETESEMIVVVPVENKMIAENDVNSINESENVCETHDNDDVEIAIETDTIEDADKTLDEEEQNSSLQKNVYNLQDINIMLGGVMSGLLYDDYFRSYNDSPIILGPCAKVSYLPIDIKNFKLGFELAADITEIMMRNEYIEVYLPMILLQCNFVGRLNFYDGKLGVNVKLGGGATFIKKQIIYHSSMRQTPEDSYHLNSCANFGVSFNWIPFKHLIFETGVDFTHLFIPDMNSGILNTYVCVGLRF